MQDPVIVGLMRTSTPYGPLARSQICKLLTLIGYPSYTAWDDAHNIILNSDGMTLRQAVEAIDPSFPRIGKFVATDGTVIAPWPKIPDPETVRQAIVHATH